MEQEETFDDVRAWWERTKGELEGAEVRLAPSLAV